MFTNLSNLSVFSDRMAGTQISFGYFEDGTWGIEVQPNGLAPESMNTLFSNALEHSQLPDDVTITKNPIGTQWYIKGNIDALMERVKEGLIRLPISWFYASEISAQLKTVRASYEAKNSTSER